MSLVALCRGQLKISTWTSLKDRKLCHWCQQKKAKTFVCEYFNIESASPMWIWEQEEIWKINNKNIEQLIQKVS